MRPSLKSILVPGAGELIPGAANALAARVIEATGYRVLLVTGAGVTNTYLGKPDVGLISVKEMADHVWTIRDAVDIALIADGDTGFGNGVNVYRTVQMFERAGASAIQLEDQVFPKRCGHFDGKAVVSAGEMVGKIKAAVDARKSEETLVLARTDAIATDGVDAAIERAHLFHEAGADLLFVEAPQAEADLARIGAECPGPQICNLVIGGKTPILSQKRLQEMGFAGIIYANAPLQAAVKAMREVLTAIRENGSAAGLEHMVASFKERQETVNHDFYKQLEARYAFNDAD